MNPETAPVAPAAPVSPVPAAPQSPTTSGAVWPGAFGVLKPSKEIVKVNLLPILGLSILSLVLGSLGNKETHTSSLVGFIGALVSLWVTSALILTYFAGENSKKLPASTALKQAARYYLQVLLGTVISLFILFLSFVALVIPFFFVAPRLALVNYFLIDRNLGAMDAVKASWRETKGHSLKVWGVLAVTILFGVLCFVIVGIYFIFFYQAALAVLYRYVVANSQTAPLAAIPVSPVPASAEASVVPETTAAANDQNTPPSA